MAIFAAFVVDASVRTKPLLTGAICATILVGLAAVDEVRELPRSLRLVIQFIIACALVAGGQVIAIRVEPFVPGAPVAALSTALTVLWIVGTTNAYNFMDGLNGIAAAEAIICSFFLTMLFIRTGDVAEATFAIALGAAAAGFLPWNLTGSIFMGDSGSTTFGLLLALLVVRASQVGISLIAAALPLAPFLLDAGLTLLRRAARGERFFATSHRAHAYQRLQQSGWSHSAVTAAWAVLATVSGFIGLVVATRPGPVIATSGIVIVIATHVAVFDWINRRQPTMR